MEVIILGSRTSDEAGRVSPIVVPVDSLPIPGISILSNPLIIRDFGLQSEVNSLWVRSSDLQYIRPGTNTDKVNIGGSSFVYNEKLRVVGNIQADGFNLNQTTNITLSNGHMYFRDDQASATLYELLNSSTNIAAENVSIEDLGDYYTSDNVEDALQEIQVLIQSNLHTHANKELLDTYDQTNVDITSAVDLKHDAVTISTSNGLSIIGQALSMAIANSTVTGALDKDDWTSFNTKLDPTDTLNAIKDLTLSPNSLIIGISDTEATVLSVGSANQVLSVNSAGNALEWKTITSGGTGIFSVPTGFTSISNPIGGVTNTAYNPVTTLNGVTILKVLQDMLFPAPSSPSFVNPTTTLTVTGVSGTYLENGITATVDVSASLNSVNGPGGKPYAIANGSPSFTKNGSAYTTGSSVTFTADTTFSTTYPYKPNGQGEADPEKVTLANGSVVYANQYTGANSGNVTANKVFTIVDPIYYGCVDLTGVTYDWSNNIPWTELKAALTKQVIALPTSSTISVSTYTGSPDPDKWIVVLYPDSAGTNTASECQYKEGGYANVLSAFSSTRLIATTDGDAYERPNTVKAQYRLYAQRNSYNSGGTVTYIFYY